jgi:hypothetical protein
MVDVEGEDTDGEGTEGEDREGLPVMAGPDEEAAAGDFKARTRGTPRTAAQMWRRI